MVNYKKLKVGDKLVYRFNDFDGHGSFDAVVTEAHKDYALAMCDGMRMRIDNWTADMFVMKHTEEKENPKMKKYYLICSVDGIDIDFETTIEATEEPSFWECYNIAADHGCDYWTLSEEG